MELSRGMRVRTLDGKRLGRVRNVEDGAFITRKGLLRRREERIPFGEIDHLEGDTVFTRVQPEFHLGESVSEQGSAPDGSRRAGTVHTPLEEEH